MLLNYYKSGLQTFPSKTCPFSSCGTGFAAGQTFNNVQQKEYWRRGGFPSILQLSSWSQTLICHTAWREPHTAILMPSGSCHIVWLLLTPLYGSLGDVLVSDWLFAGKGSIFIFLHHGCKGLIFTGAVHVFFIVVYCTSYCPVCGQEDDSTANKVFIEVHHFCVQTHVMWTG